MAISVVMPALEMAQETGKLLSWLKKEGDAIAKGEPLLEIETDKVVFELEAPGDGVLAGVKSNAGDVVPVGQTIAWIVAPGEQPAGGVGSRGAQRANGTAAASASPRFAERSIRGGRESRRRLAGSPRNAASISPRFAEPDRAEPSPAKMFWRRGDPPQESAPQGSGRRKASAPSRA